MQGFCTAALRSLLGAVVAATCLADQQPAASISLENPDGQRLDFLRLAISATVFGPFVFVQNELVFLNPEDRRMEGRFSFVLPSGPEGPAAPSRFAMEIQGRLMEGEVVDRYKARQVYREILHEARDPALLEQGPGNTFTARVFPIESRAIVRLFLSYSLTLPLRSLRRTLTLPLRGLPEIQEFSFQAVAAGLGGRAVTATCSLPHFGDLNATALGQDSSVRFSTDAPATVVPDADAVLDMVEEPSQGASSFSVDGGDMVSLFTVGNSSAVDVPFTPSFWSVYIDTSASTADTAVVRVPLIAALLDAMPQADVEVWAFDIEVVQLRARGPKTQGLGGEIRSLLEARMPLGATDLQRLLTHVEANAGSANAPVGVILLTDSIPTVMERGAAQLGRLLADNSDRVVEIGMIGSKFDSSTGTAIAASGNGRIVQIPLTASGLPTVTQTAWADFTRPLGRRAVPEVSSGWVWPATVADLHQGDEVVIYNGGGSGLTVPRPTLEIAGNNETSTLVAGAAQVASASFSSLLAREATRARLEQMETQRQLARNKTDADALQADIVRLSVQKRVMTPHTALIVLETEEDYVRFGIPRDQLAPVLVTTDTGVELKQRSELMPQALPTTTTTTLGATTTLTTTSNSSNSSNNTTDMCSVDFPCDQLMDAITAPAGQQESRQDFVAASVESASTRKGCLSSILAVLLACLVTLLGCDEASAANVWTDLQAVAQESIDKNPAGGPRERLRDNAAQYAAALHSLKRHADLKAFCAGWLTWDPANSLVFEYLSRAAQQLGEAQTSLRAVTSLVEVAPRDPELLLRGSWMGITLGSPEGYTWAQRFAERSLEERTDNPNTYRALGLAAWLAGDHSRAARAYAQGLSAQFHGRYGDVGRVIGEEGALFLRSVKASDPQLATSLAKVLPTSQSQGSGISLRITLSWLTDANDVDLHVQDPLGEECYYANKRTTQMQLYSDQTQGLGPEVVVVDGKARSGVYKIGVKYYSAGSMGASRGTVVIWQLNNGVPIGQARLEVFTLPAGYSNVLPVAEITVQ